MVKCLVGAPPVNHESLVCDPVWHEPVVHGCGVVVQEDVLGEEGGAAGGRQIGVAVDQHGLAIWGGLKSINIGVFGYYIAIVFNFEKLELLYGTKRDIKI